MEENIFNMRLKYLIDFPLIIKNDEVVILFSHRKSKFVKC